MGQMFSSRQLHQQKNEIAITNYVSYDIVPDTSERNTEYTLETIERQSQTNKITRKRYARSVVVADTPQYHELYAAYRTEIAEQCASVMYADDVDPNTISFSELKTRILDLSFYDIHEPILKLRDPQREQIMNPILVRLLWNIPRLASNVYWLLEVIEIMKRYKEEDNESAK